ncbi:MAG: T9SS type A sorting domain-containing protein [Bacteroidetes bacterium]|nr:T9SS type A sorting domain-containing protein [Bacteroidota bacterium]
MKYLPTKKLLIRVFSILSLIFSGEILFSQNQNDFLPVGNDGLFSNGYYRSPLSLAEDDQGNLFSGTCGSILQWNGSDWIKAYEGFNGEVQALLFDDQGRMIASGEFDSINGTPFNHIALLDGNNWTTIGNGLSVGAGLMKFDDQGNLYAMANGGLYLAKWDGTSWDTLGSNIWMNILTIEVDGQGHIYAGGRDEQGAATTNVFNYWDGNAWSTLFHGADYNYEVQEVLLDAQNNVYVGGKFDTIKGVTVNNLAKWDGNNWSSVGGGCDCIIYSMALDDQGNLYVAGNISQIGSLTNEHIAMWDGNTWQSVGGGTDHRIEHLLQAPDGGIYARGLFSKAGGMITGGLALWENGSWHSVGKGFYVDENLAVTSDPMGNVYLSGYIANFPGLDAQWIARWDGTNWNGLNASDEFVIKSMITDSQNHLYASGYLYINDTIWANHIARWNGSVWDTLGNGLEGNAYKLLVDNNGNILAIGDFTGLWSWDGTQWTRLDTGTTDFFTDMEFDSQGNLYASGWFSIGGSDYPGIAQWNGTAWNLIGSEFISEPYHLAIDSQDRIYAVGNFVQSSPINKEGVVWYDGTDWQIFTELSGSMDVIEVDGEDRLCVGGARIKIGTSPEEGSFAVWDGNNWQLPDEMKGLCDAYSNVTGLYRDYDGSVLIIGEFEEPYPYLARWNGGDSIASPIQPEIQKANISIFPNPSNGLVQIQSPEVAIESIRIVDLLGRVIPAEITQSSGRIILKTDYQGLAIVLIQSENVETSWKIIFQ